MIYLKMKKKLMNSFLACLLLLSGCSSNQSNESGKEEYGCRVINFYDYDQSAPKNDVIDDAYFDDVLFAGDSRMGSLALYGTRTNAQVAYVTSLNLLLIDNMKVDPSLSSAYTYGEDETLMDVLSTTQKKNIYLLFGINEIRNPNFNAFGEKLQEIVTMLKTNNPEVNIYLMLAYHPDYISDLPEPALSEHLDNLNTTIKEIAKNNHTYFLNLDDELDEDGTIKDDYVWDGLHFNVAGAHAMEDYISTHVVRRESYVKEICQ